MGEGGVSEAARRSMAQRFSALEHAAKNDLDAGRCAQALDPAVLVLAFDVARLVLVPACLAPARLRGGEPPGVRQPQQGLGLEPPDIQESPTDGTQRATQGSTQERHVYSRITRPVRVSYSEIHRLRSRGAETSGKCSFSLTSSPRGPPRL